ncbi:hypothetical protein L218DRAFT_218932 [Marasmius fiardii PR-910]|nr:hypothetical protein L218DRAFT_218932 [Marasmius fiardii PR-910]
MSFVGASRFTVEGDAVNYVSGNQFIQFIQEEKERTIYDEFNYVKMGDVYSLKSVGHVEYMKWKWRAKQFQAIKKITTAEVYPGSDRKFTVVSYQGPEAKKVGNCSSGFCISQT